MQKRRFKVITPIDKRDGGKYWMRVGSGFTNKDDSINLYLDAFPVAYGKELTLQVREMTDEDFRRGERGERRTFSPAVPGAAPGAMSNSSSAASDAVPF